MLLEDFVLVGKALGQTSKKAIKRHYLKTLRVKEFEEPTLTKGQVTHLKDMQVLHFAAPMARIIKVEVAMSTLESMNMNPTCLEPLLYWECVNKVNLINRTKGLLTPPTLPHTSKALTYKASTTQSKGEDGQMDLCKDPYTTSHQVQDQGSGTIEGFHRK